MQVSLHRGDCREVLRDLPDNSVDAVVTDPPYELGFMGKSWDAAGIAYDVEMWREVLRVLKPGGHLLSFGGTRTYHRMACAIEDAGFEIRDQIQWLYGSGFPKSFNISKGIDKMMGADREDSVWVDRYYDGKSRKELGYSNHNGSVKYTPGQNGNMKDLPATPEAQQWDGWGSALKPANEPVCLARKPLSEKTIVENVLKWGTGGINVDGCRIDGKVTTNPLCRNAQGFQSDGLIQGDIPNGSVVSSGRFPANVILDEEAGRLLDEQTQYVKPTKPHKVNSNIDKYEGWGNITNKSGEVVNYQEDMSIRGASRFFYCAKSSRSERNAGLEGMEEKIKAQSGGAQGAESRGDDEYKQDSIGLNRITKVQNFHPTVKPISLMRYLCRLITPPNGVVLDPFMGSGTTGCAAVLEGFDFIGIEQDAEYLEIAKRRIEHWQTQFTIELQPSLI